MSPFINIILANVIRFFHMCIILFVLFTPITNITYFLILHITLCISLVVHWLANNNMCSLSMFESKLRGIPYTDSFSHQFIAPMYDISNTSWSTVCYVFTIFVMCVSLYKLYNSGKISHVYSLYKSQCDQQIPYPNIYHNCIKELFRS